MSSNPAHGEVYSIQLYVSVTATIVDVTGIVLKVALNTINLTITLKISGDYIRNKIKLLYTYVTFVHLVIVIDFLISMSSNS